MIYLSAEVVSGLGEDTFWTWFHREFPTSKFMSPTSAERVGDSDAVLRYSTLGSSTHIGGKTIALMWELHPEMKRVFKSSEWDRTLSRIYECGARSDYRVVATPEMMEYYEHLGQVDVLPIGVDTDLFHPRANKTLLRRKYGIQTDGPLGIWVGTGHPMKGFIELVDYARKHPHTHWIIVWKQHVDLMFPFLSTQFCKIPQEELAELMSAADFFVCTGALRPFYMVEWEAMACNLPFVMLTEREFTPSKNPREDVFRLGWDRHSAKKAWAQYILERGIVL